VEDGHIPASWAVAEFEKKRQATNKTIGRNSRIAANFFITSPAFF
jgi:hypothetical protein